MEQSLLVTYDLSGRDETSAQCAALIDAIEAHGECRRIMCSTWIVVTNSSATTVVDDLWEHMRNDDRLFVAPIDKPGAWANVLADDSWMFGRP